VTPDKLAVAAITIDFGNTLVRVDRAGLRAVVENTGEALVGLGIISDREAFMTGWVEERERQFREDIAEFREPDIERRAIRVLARLRGAVPPPPEDRWDDVAAATLVQQAELDAVADVYGAEFVGRMAPVPDATATLGVLSARGFALAILSNWPLGTVIDRFAAAHGWLPYLRAVVVSDRVGWIKPHPAIFRAAEEALGIGGDGAGMILHVGDDWAADVVGAKQAGWQAAYLRNRQVDTPLPTSEPGDGLETGVAVTPDLVIDELSELDALIELGSAPTVEAVESAPQTWPRS
jgi:FMN phosphatase YigB (HAD superfamily)